MNKKSLSDPVPFFDLNRQYTEIKPDLDPVLAGVFSGPSDNQIDFVEAFEKPFAIFSQTKYSIGVSSGTDAIHLGLRALGVGKGCEVIVPAISSASTVWGISYLGATPVFADCTPDTWNVDPFEIENKITKKTRAILGVHTYGLPFDIKTVKEIAKKNKIALLEDCSQAHGALFMEKSVGSFGDIACFSFFPEKNLGSYGEAGGITTNIKKHVSKIRELINWENAEQNFHSQIGFNLKMDQLQAAILGVKLKELPSWNRKREYIGERYRTGIQNAKVTHQEIPDGCKPVYSTYVISLKNRDALKTFLGTKKNRDKKLVPWIPFFPTTPEEPRL
ncbi:MAG: DegT/DnrJ/EryC1/StrS family aminotransferase [Nitrospinota bacterium]